MSATHWLGALPPLSSALGLFTPDLGIDLGCANSVPHGPHPRVARGTGRVAEAPHHSERALAAGSERRHSG